jgi:hypothetical protein
LVDPWNALRTGELFAYVTEASALLQHATRVDGSPH